MFLCQLIVVDEPKVSIQKTKTVCLQPRHILQVQVQVYLVNHHGIRKVFLCTSDLVAGQTSRTVDIGSRDGLLLLI